MTNDKYKQDIEILEKAVKVLLEQQLEAMAELTMGIENDKPYSFIESCLDEVKYIANTIQEIKHLITFIKDNNFIFQAGDKT